MQLELRDLGIEVATVNPGPFLTGFDDRMFQTDESWTDAPIRTEAAAWPRPACRVGRLSLST